MKVIYFDCFAGISGDMILGSLIDLGLDPEALAIELRKLSPTFNVNSSYQTLIPCFLNLFANGRTKDSLSSEA